MYTIRWIESSHHKPSPWSLDCWCTWMMILCMLLTYEAKAEAGVAATYIHPELGCDSLGPPEHISFRCWMCNSEQVDRIE